MLQERDLPDHYRLWRREDGSTGIAPGRVYKATDRRTGGIVALRLFDAGTVWAETLTRRGNLLLKMELPHVAALRDLFTQDESLVTVTDFLIGESLAERLRRRGPLTAAAVREAAAQGVEALAALHARGVQHGSLGTSNILFPDDPRQGDALVLVDAGLDPEAGATGAPEDFRRLGICLWNALTGEFPFGGELPAAGSAGSADFDALLRFFALTLCGEPDRQPDIARNLREALGVAAKNAKAAAPASPLPVAPASPPRSPAPTTSTPSPPAAKLAEPATLTMPAAPEKVAPAVTTERAAGEAPAIIPLAPRGVEKVERPVVAKAGVLVAEPRPVPLKPGQAASNAPAGKGKAVAAPVSSTVSPASTNEAAKPVTDSARPASGSGWRITGIVLLLVVLGTAAAVAFTHRDWLMGKVSHVDVAAPSAETTPPAAPAPTPPRAPASKARIDRIKELQPGLLDVLKFVPEIRRVGTLPVADSANVPEESEIERLKTGFEWLSPSSPNFHRTVMLFVLGYEKGAVTADSLAASQHCADALAATLSSGGLTCPIYTCGMGSGENLPEIAPPPGEVGRFVEVWAAFTLF